MTQIKLSHRYMKMLNRNQNEIILLLSFIFILLWAIFYFGYTLPYEIRETQLSESTPIPFYTMNQMLKPHDFIYGLHLDFCMLSVVMIVLYLDIIPINFKYTKIIKKFYVMFLTNKKFRYFISYSSIFIILFVFLRLI